MGSLSVLRKHHPASTSVYADQLGGSPGLRSLELLFLKFDRLNHSIIVMTK